MTLSRRQLLASVFAAPVVGVKSLPAEQSLEEHIRVHLETAPPPPSGYQDGVEGPVGPIGPKGPSADGVWETEEEFHARWLENEEHNRRYFASRKP